MRRRNLALVICLFSIVVSLIFTALDDMFIHMRIGAWPIIGMSGTLALLSSFLTKDRVLAPLSCFGAIMGSAALVAMTHDLRYAQLHIATPIALAVSAPSLFVACWLARK